MKDIFSKNLKMFREKLGITQEDLAEKCNVSPSCVSRWESGIWHPSEKNQTLLAKIFDVPLGFLYLPPGEPSQNLLLQQIMEIAKGLSEDRQEFLLDVARKLKRMS